MLSALQRRPGNPVCLVIFTIFVISAVANRGFGQLKSALEVRSLSFEEAESGEMVELTGTVIFPDPPATIFIQDQTAGTFFQMRGGKAPRAGDLVKVKGRTYPGLYLPGIKEVQFEIIDHPGLPKPRPVNFDELVSGTFHYQHVSVEGVIRWVEPTGEGTGMATISLGSQKLELWVKAPLPNFAKALVGNRVRVVGLAAGEINGRRQLVKPYLRVLKWSDIEIQAPAMKVEQIPMVTAQELLTFQFAKKYDPRVRMEGQVIARQGETLYLRNGDLAFLAELNEVDADLSVSDQVEIMGFPEMRGFRAMIANSTILQKSSGDSSPEPFPISWSQLVSGDRDGNLISVEGVLAHWYLTENETRLALRSKDGKSSIQVRVPELVENLRSGMELDVYGICLVETTRTANYRAMPDSVVILSRHAGDIQVLKAPNWWTARRLAWALIGLTCVTSLAGLWIYLLRRQVEQQTEELRSGIEQKAALEERQRIAREFHDTLEQDLAGLSLRLDAAVAQSGDKGIQKFIIGSRSLVSRIQSETRNLVADLRESPSKMADLNTSLGELAEKIPGRVGPEVTLHLDQSCPLLTSRVVRHIKMIAQEAVTNAIKHAGATKIDITTEIEHPRLMMTVVDNGKGFDIVAETSGKTGHFGCMGMRERARKLKGNLEWQSEPGRTCVKLTMNQIDEQS
ncbi:MAG: sensor histidine kinase [Verrucomicrobiales bacterium]|nr:sensor histidine kinase [Verrucomicrobiales bacterium]